MSVILGMFSAIILFIYFIIPEFKQPDNHRKEPTGTLAEMKNKDKHESL